MGFIPIPLSPRCGAADCDSLHTFWTCPCNAEIDDEEVRSTQSLVPAAVEKAAEHPCLWLRGILPAFLTAVSSGEQPDTVLRVKADAANPARPRWTGGTYYGDASGGKYTSIPAIRRIGCGVAKIDDRGNIIFGFSFDLPAEAQTVGRGELFSLLFVVQNLEEDVEFTYIIDNESVFKSYHYGPEACKLSNNADLYAQLFTLLSLTNLKLTLRWMPSHLKDTDVLQEGISRTDVLGNRVADRLAGEASWRFQVSLNASTPLVYYKSLVERIQRRLACILQNLPERKKVPKVSNKVTLPSLESLFPASSHILYTDQGRVSFARCNSSFKIGNISLRPWIESPCPDIGKNHDRPQPMRFEATHIGNNVVHPSHNIYMYKQMLYCNSCGSRASTALKKLARRCEPPTPAGIAALKKFRAGKHPGGVVQQWPVDRLDPSVASAAARVPKARPAKRRRTADASNTSLETSSVQFSAPVLASSAASSSNVPSHIVNSFDDNDADIELEPSDLDN